MIEPFLVLTAASLAKGGLEEFGGKLFEKRLEKGGEHILDRFVSFWREAATDPRTGLPRNGDVHRASLASLRGAMGVLLFELAGRIEPEKSWLNRWAASRSGADWLTFEIFPSPKTPHQVWLGELRKAVKDPAFKTLHDQLRLSDDQVRECFKAGQLCHALGGGLADKLLEWSRVHSHADEHPDFEALLRHGWQISDSAPTAVVSKGLAAKGHTPQPPPPQPVTLAHAYCYFFREHLKTDPKVFNSFTADTLNTLRTQLDKQGAQVTAELRSLREAVAQLAAQPPVFSQFEAWLTPQLGELKELLAGVKDQLDALARGQNELKQHQGEILVAITALRTEVARGNPAAQPALDVFTTHVTRLERKLDHLIGGLPIQRFQLPDPPTRELELLHAKHRAVTLLGRGPDLDALCAWVESSESISARLLVGGAGTGKTRLGFELLLRVADALPGWQAGLLGSADLRRLVARIYAPDFNWPAPTLLVVDYAQTLAGPLGELLRVLTFKRKGQPPLRVLLLERQPGDWFEDLLRKEDGDMPRAVRGLFHPPEPVPLTPLPPGELRRAVLQQTLEKASALARTPPLALPPPGNPDYDRSLERPLFDQPLNLMLAALAASELGLLAALKRERIDLGEALAEKELRRVERFARDPENLAQKVILRHLAACATMERGFAPDELDRAVREELAALGRAWPDGPGDLADVLRQALGGEHLPVAPVEPDFVGEALVLLALAKADDAAWIATVERCCRRDSQNTPATLLHTFQNFGRQPGHAAPLLTATDALIRAGLADREPALLLGIESALPHQTVELRRRAAEVTRHLYERLKATLQAGRDELKPEVARLANNLGVRLSEAGRRAEALVPAQEAVELYRALVRQNPDAFQPDLAMSLGAMSQVLVGLERHGEAVVVLAEGIRTLTPAFTQLPEAFAPLIGALARDYLKAAEAAQMEPDMDLLAPVVAVFERLQSEAPASPDANSSQPTAEA